MKNKLGLLTAFLFCTTFLYSQQKDHKFFAELSLGPSFPIGKFAGKTVKPFPDDDQPAGLAKPGLSSQFLVGYYLKENAGVLISEGSSFHAQDNSGYENYLKAAYTTPGAGPVSVDADRKSWKIIKLMAGGFLITPLNTEETLVLVTKVTAGACKTAIPAYNYKIYDSNGALYNAGTGDKTSLAWAFCYQVSMGLKYKLNDKLHVLFDVNSFNSTPQKKYTYNPNPVSSGPPQEEQKNIKYKLAEVNALIGIGIDF